MNNLKTGIAPGIFNRVSWRVAWLIGAGLGTGKSPIAPGTVGSVAALLIYVAVPLTEDSLGLYLLVGSGFFVGVWAAGILETPDNIDPGFVVWDEFVGMWATCLLLPKTIPWMIAAFFVFRALDIYKPWPVRRLESLPGGWGIMGDDLLAGFYGAAGLNLVRIVFF